jgi:hypothetical protein
MELESRRYSKVVSYTLIMDRAQVQSSKKNPQKSRGNRIDKKSEIQINGMVFTKKIRENTSKSA